MNMIARPPKEALDAAIDILGGVTAAARKLPKVKGYQVIQQWRSAGVPIEHCPAIEKATNGAVTRYELRPNDWWEIWPELVTEDHPIPIARKAA